MARGRPRKAGARHPSGDLRFIPDQGSAGLLVHRALDINPHLIGLNVEEVLKRGACKDSRAAYPLGILYARHIVTGQQHYAGRRYAGLFVRAVRGISVPSILGDLIGKGALGSAHTFNETVAKDAAEIRDAYLEAREILDKAGDPAATAVDDVAVYEIWPGRDQQVKSLRLGLNVLHAHFEDSDKRAQR